MGLFIPLSKITFKLAEVLSPERLRADYRGATRIHTGRAPRCLEPGVLYADIADYARLAERAGGAVDNPDIELAEARLAAFVGADGGRIVQRDGDAVVAVFDDGDRALHCAISLLRATASLNAERDRDRQVWLRLAVNLGVDALQVADGSGIEPAFARALALFASAREICITRLARAGGTVRRRRESANSPRRVAAVGVPLYALWIDLGQGISRGPGPAGAVSIAAEFS